MADTDTVSNANVCIQTPQSDITRRSDEWQQTTRARSTNTISARKNGDYPRLCAEFPSRRHTAYFPAVNLYRSITKSSVINILIGFAFVKVKR
jgi:hypothetical protein